MLSPVRRYSCLVIACGALPWLLGACGTLTERLPSGSAPRIASARIEGAADISPRLAAVIRHYEIPGMVAVALRGDRIIAAGAAGVRRTGFDVPVTLDDQFAIASAAKAMSATVVARLVEQGKLAWDTPVATLFAARPPEIDPAWREITVRQFLEHQVGLKDHLLLFARVTSRGDGDQTVQRRTYARQILARAPDFPAGSRFHYNNTDYVIVGAALEEATGRTWTQLMHDEVFHPLGISSGGFGPPGQPGGLEQPWGHGGRRPLGLPLLPGAKPYDPGDPHADYPLAAAPSGFVHVTIRDWAKFAALHLRGHAANPRRITSLLRADTFDILHTPVRADDPYAGGWFTGTRAWAKGARPGDRGRVIFHAGNNGRWTSAVYLAPEIDFAILVVCNRGDMSKGVDEVASQLVGALARENSTR